MSMEEGRTEFCFRGRGGGSKDQGKGRKGPKPRNRTVILLAGVPWGAVSLCVFVATVYGEDMGWYLGNCFSWCA